MTNDELKPCPFCGGEPDIEVKFVPSTDGEDYKYTFISCPVHNFIHDAETWNTRPIEDELRARIAELEAANSFHPRAAKLMAKRKNFVVVAEDEPYFMDVYRTIRAHEMKSGRWTDDDESRYSEILWD